MLSYNKDFLLQSSDPNENFPATKHLISRSPPLDRSTGSPDSLRSESSSDSSVSIAHVLKSLQHQAAIVIDTKAELEKPAHSYIALISMAILSTKDNRMVLGEIYEFIMRKFPYYNNQHKAWRNSIRHNLSINECFIKAGRADNGKGNYWSIHPACVEDFSKGDFRRRQARRRARKSVKNVNRNQFTASEYHIRSGYVPMTSSSLGYQPLMPSSFGYQPMTSSPSELQPVSSLPFRFQPMTSPLIGHTSMPSPSGYQPMTSQTLSVSQYQQPSYGGSKLFHSSMDLHPNYYGHFPVIVPSPSDNEYLSVC